MYYAVIEDGHLVKRACPVMPLLEGDKYKEENAIRSKENEKARAKFDQMVADKAAVLLPEDFSEDLSCYDLVDGSLSKNSTKEKEFNNSSARASRRREYPDIGDQLDAIMKWVATSGAEFPEELQNIADQCMSVKDKYPLI